MSGDERGVGPRTVLVGLIGEGVGPSLTPPMHEREGTRHGLSYVYRSIDLAPGEGTESRMRQLIESARRFGFSGLNITHPVKQTVIPLLDELSPGAQAVGAVNTIVFAEDRLVGHNTDVTGFGAALDEQWPGADLGAVVLVGAGGAGGAVAAALAARAITSLTIVDVDARRAEALAAQTVRDRTDDVRGVSSEAADALLAEAQTIANATPIGMAGHPGAAIDLALIGPRQRVIDVVYRPAETALLAHARARGCPTMSGLGMAMHQAADAFEIFTGEPADRAEMLADLKSLVAGEATADPIPGAPTRGER
jgi:shikimate dehydrogenase